jgi:hypothetical protein
MEEIVSDSSARLPLSKRVRLYFTDLSFYTRTTLGVGETSKRQLWLVACYLAFGSGVFCRQIINLSNFPSVDVELARLKLSVLAGSFIVGLAIFPLLVRLVRKLADYISDEEKRSARRKSVRDVNEKESSRGGWNVIHVFTSFTVGFFVNLAYEQVLEIIRTKIH